MEIFVGAIKNDQGQFLESMHEFSGPHWTDNEKDIKVFVKLSTARMTVTRIATFYEKKKMQKPIPVITQFIVTDSIDIDQTKRVQKYKSELALKEQRQEQRRMNARKEQLEREFNHVKRQLEKIQQELNK